MLSYMKDIKWKENDVNYCIRNVPHIIPKKNNEMYSEEEDVVYADYTSKNLSPNDSNYIKGTMKIGVTFQVMLIQELIRENKIPNNIYFEEALKLKDEI